MSSFRCNVKLGTDHRGLKRIKHRVVNRVEDDLFVGEFYLKLCRVNVYVNESGIYVNIKHANWEFILRNPRSERLLNCRHSGLALDVASVDEEVFHISVGFEKIRLGNVARYGDSVGTS